MKDPDRLSDIGDDEPGAALLRSAKRYRVSTASRKRAFATVGLAAGATALASGKAAAGGLAVGSKVIGWIVVSVGAALVVGGYIALASSESSSSKPRTAPASVAAPARRAAEASSPPAPVENAVPIAPSASASLAPPSRASGSAAAGAAGAPPAGLQAEITALDAVTKAVAQGDAARALLLLDAYGHNFPRGSLTAEATLLRAEALDGAGRHAEAVRLARAFVKRDPKSPLAERMRRLAGD